MIDILRAAAQRHHDLSEEHRKGMSEASVNATHLTERVSTLRKEKLVLEEELKLKNRVLERAVNLTNKVNTCKNCSRSFAAKLEKEFQLCRSYNEGDFYRICCAKCSASHAYAEYCK